MSKTEDIKKEIKNRVYEWIIDPASWLNNEKECEDHLSKLLDKLVENDGVLGDVIKQRELLIKFLEFGRDRHYTPLTQCSMIDMVEDFELNQ